MAQGVSDKAKAASQRKAESPSKHKTRDTSKRKAKRASKRRAASELPPIIEQVRRDMEDAWRQDDQLLEKFFPVSPHPDSQYQKARKKHFNERCKRWKGISATPKPLSRLYTPLTTLMNDLLLHYGIDLGRRRFINTHIRRRGVSNALDVVPGIFLAGVGPEFANNSEVRPGTAYYSGISALEVLLDSEDQTAARDRLAVHMFETFRRQANRRFAFGLTITQHTFTVYMFDHSGAVASRPCNYHAHPEQFCVVISGLASEKEQIGFDMTVFADPGGHDARIRTHEPGNGVSVTETEYIIKEGLFKFASLVGRGTVCWLTSRADDPESTFVIKDAWIAPSELAGRESEGSLLRHAQGQGLVSGVVQIHHFEEVRCSDNAAELDTVLHNRRVEGTSPDELKVERVHNRIVMATYGKTLDKFSTRMELLLAFHDAVLAHRQLHDVAGILHRDISVRNILINPGGVEGDRGILIDFDHSIRVGDTSLYSTKTKIGTWRYMSRDVLRGRGHTYLDDLESFYYVLCWVLASFDSAGVLKTEPPPEIPSWDKPDSDQVKGGHIATEFTIPISPWFGDSLWDLATDLHDFFETRLLYPPSTSDPVKDYDEFTFCIRECIAELEKEELEGINGVVSAPSVSSVDKSIPGKRKRGNPDEEELDVDHPQVRDRSSPGDSPVPGRRRHAR